MRILIVTVVVALFSANALYSQELLARVARVEVGPLIGLAKGNLNDDAEISDGKFHGSIGGKVVFNINRYLAADADVSDASVGRTPFFFNPEHEVQSNIGAKLMARFREFGTFGLIGLGIINRPITVAGGPACTGGFSYSFCGTLERETVFGPSIGGGVEVLQQRRIGLRLDFRTVVIPMEQDPYYGSATGHENRWQVGLGVMFHLW